MRFVIRAALVTWLALASSHALAERCIGPMDNSAGVLALGIPAVSPEDITFCDDFDSYCGVNCGSECRTFLPPYIPWLGYPPTPDDVCDPDVMVLATEPDGYISNTAWSGYYFNRPFHWARPQLYSSEGNPVSTPSQRFETGLYPSRWEGWNGNEGWHTEPYTMIVSGNTSSNQYHTFSLVPAAQHKFPGSNAIDGTDTNPLTLRFWGFADAGADPSSHPFYVELRLDDDHAPTDYVLANSTTSTAYANCDTLGRTDYPVVCQAKLLPGSTSGPPGCPPLSTQVRASLAFGMLAQLDRDPCSLTQSYERKPINYHASVFDGLHWYDLRSNIFPPDQIGGFNWSTGQGFFQMTIKSTTIELLSVRPSHYGGTTLPTMTVSSVTIARQYIGPFNKISMGAAPSCELDPVTGDCKTPGQYDVWRYMNTNSAKGAYGNLYIDRVALFGGIGGSSEGACCKSDGTCSIETSSACTTAGGTWRGLNTTCETACQGACCEPRGVCNDVLISECSGSFQGYGSTCSTASICPCPIPFADHDWDGDVDMDDFAGFQACINTGNPNVLAPGCECWDVTGAGGTPDGLVNDLDFVWFAGNGLSPEDPNYIAGCASGPGVDADDNCGPSAP